jgi:hypothetical protein
MAQAQQQLSNKDGSLFRQVVRHFENKQYKKGAYPLPTIPISDLLVVQASKQRNRSFAKRPIMPTHKP